MLCLTAGRQLMPTYRTKSTDLRSLESFESGPPSPVRAKFAQSSDDSAEELDESEISSDEEGLDSVCTGEYRARFLLAYMPTCTVKGGDLEVQVPVKMPRGILQPNAV